MVEARLENIFKDGDKVKFNRAEYNMLNIDGAYLADEVDGKKVDVAPKMAALHKLLEALVVHAGAPGPTDSLAGDAEKEKSHNPWL